MAANDETVTDAGRGLRLALFAIFAVSGFAGLIYEAVWGRYLRLFLGHSAYAQTFVIAIFMGGMALGSWYSSSRSKNWSSLLRGYAYTEIAIGLFALVFQGLFETSLDFAYETAMPAIGSALGVELFKQCLALALILPPSILLGMTFPLMSGGVIRLFPNLSGSSLSFLYFTNSIGAAAGVMITGFVLVDLLGLPGTVLLAGLLNIVVGLFVWLLSRTVDETPLPETPLIDNPTEETPEPISPKLLFTVAALTGFASFLYEIGWIRMLSMVLGSSSHAFEIMLGTFIAGLAFGGLWIKGRIDTLTSPVRYLAVLQWVMGILALATLFLYDQSFDLMTGLMKGVARTDEGYFVFNLGSNLIAIAIMFPAAFCAGTTLPLITFTLLRQGYGEKGIGAVYAANTVGGIAGVFGATHIGLPFLGLQGLVTLGAFVDIALGVALFGVLAGSFTHRKTVTAAVVGLALLVATSFAVEFDPLKMASGVYRTNKIMTSDRYTSLFHGDGKTASIDVLGESGGSKIIATNGKPDASINFDPEKSPTPDESTQSMLAAIPLAANPNARTAAVIGLGSGMTSSVLLCSDALERLDTVEIESKMIEGAKLFSPRNDRVFKDPRSRIIEDDARTFFSATHARYDIIISEPSNPWVSGVASLFSKEFYQRIRQHLNPGGVLAQWIQLYELSPALLATIVTAMHETFPDFTLFATDGSNLVLLARADGPIGPLSGKIFDYPALKEELAPFRVIDQLSLELHRVGDARTLVPLFMSYEVPANSDYFPYLDARAARARFLGDSARPVLQLAATAMPAMEILGSPRHDDGWLERPAETPPANAQVRLPRIKRASVARAISRKLLGLPTKPGPDKIPSSLAAATQRVHGAFTECSEAQQGDDLYRALYTLGSSINAELDRRSANQVWDHLGRSPCLKTFDAHTRGWFQLLAAAGARDGKAMLTPATRLLDSPKKETGRAGRFLLEAAMLGLIDSGKPSAARALWSDRSKELFPDGKKPLLHRLILSQAHVRMAAQAQVP